MNKIASFTVDHRYIKEWIYISRIDGDITTYDVRMRKPNTGELMSNALMHSFELVRDADNKAVLDEVKRVLGEIAAYKGEMPGNSEIECGNYRNLDCRLASVEAAEYLKKIENETENDLNYESGE